MKKQLLVVAVLVLMGMVFVPLAQSQCTNWVPAGFTAGRHILGTYEASPPAWYGIPGNALEGTDIVGYYYGFYINYSGDSSANQNLWAHSNGGSEFITCSPGAGGGYCWTYDVWDNVAVPSFYGCPYDCEVPPVAVGSPCPGCVGNQVIAIIAYDETPDEPTSLTYYTVFGGDYVNAPPRFDHDTIADGPLVANPNDPAAQIIPEPTIIGYTTSPSTVTLQWTTPSQWSYGPGGHPNYVSEIGVYWLDETLIVDSRTQNWIYIGRVSAAAAGGTQIETLPLPAWPCVPPCNVRFALSIIPLGEDNDGPTSAPFESFFVSRSSPNFLGDPGAINLISFNLSSSQGKAFITWETGTEENTAGFNIIRATSVDGKSVVINDTLIPAQGSGGGGAVYEIVDTDVLVGQKYFYILQEVENNNNKQDYGPYSITIEGKEVVKERKLQIN